MSNKKATHVPMGRQTLFGQSQKPVKRTRNGDRVVSDWEPIEPLDDLSLGLGQTYDWSKRNRNRGGA